MRSDICRAFQGEDVELNYLEAPEHQAAPSNGEAGARAEGRKRRAAMSNPFAEEAAYPDPITGRIGKPYRNACTGAGTSKTKARSTRVGPPVDTHRRYTA
jgi:hypothetical protein